MRELSLRVCANLSREAALALEVGGHGQVRVRPHPPACEPRADAPVVSLEPEDVIVGGPCARQVAPDAPARAVMACETCFHLLLDPARVSALLEAGAFLVTPGWVHGWRQWLERGGFDREGARLLFGESARKIVLADTGVDPGAPDAAAAFAEYVGLPLERLVVGVDRLALVLGELVLRRRAERAEQRLADHAMALDALVRLAPGTSEPAVIESLAGLAQVLCGASRAAFWAAHPGLSPAFSPPRTFPPGAPAAATPVAEERAASASGDGFVVRVGPEGGESGWLGIGGVRLANHLERYRQVAETLAQAGHLALQNARALAALQASRDELARHRDHLEGEVTRRTESLARTVAELKAAAERIQALRGLIPICFSCKKIRDDAGFWQRLEEYITAHSEATFSHGLCPECLDRLYPGD